MYCFSQICRICLNSKDVIFTSISSDDVDGVKIYDKILICIPEIASTYNLPEQICNKCLKFVKKMHKFKTMCLKNTTTLNKLAEDQDNEKGKSNLLVKIDLDKELDQKADKVNCFLDNKSLKDSKSEESQGESSNKMSDRSPKLGKAKEVCSNKISHSSSNKISNRIIKEVNIFSNLNLEENVLTPKKSTKTIEKTSTNGGVPRFTVSLSEWDLFESKHICRCAKDFSSYTERTDHLCKNCEGDLLGFRLSKLKMIHAESRYKNNLVTSTETNEDSDPLAMENFNKGSSTSNNNEVGFNYNDIMLSKVHSNEMVKTVRSAENNGPVDRSDNLTSVMNDSASNSSSTKETKTSSKRFYCNFCDKSYTKKYRLNMHSVCHFENNQLFGCTKCSKKFLTKEDLENHEQKHLKVVPVESSSRKRKLDDVDDEKPEAKKRKKLDVNTNDENLICSTCDKVFSSKSNLGIHLMTHIGRKEFKCSICNKEFFRKENLKKHSLTHMSERKYKCQLCEMGYNYSTNLRRHLKKRHKANNSYCSECNKQFIKKTAFQQHMRSEHNVVVQPDANDVNASEKPKFSCTALRCEESFESLKDLKKHQSVAHTDNEDLVVCDICHLSFSKKSIKKHKDSHESGKTFSCNSCDRVFDNNFILREHVRNDHPDGMKFKCSKCDRSYGYKSNLKRHLARHK